MSGKQWQFVGTEDTYKGQQRPFHANPCAIYECPYCGAERRVPIGKKPVLRRCWGCGKLVDPEDPPTEAEAKA